MPKISKIAVILANPDFVTDRRAGLLTDLCREFIETSRGHGLSVDLIDLYRDFEHDNFQPIFHPSQKNTKSVEYQIRLQKVDLIAFFHPLWLGTLPAILKGFLEQVFVAGFSYEIKKDLIKPLLTDKKALIVNTSTEPAWEHRLLYRNHNKLFWERMVFRPSGIKFQDLHFGSIRSVSDKTIQKWLKKMEQLVNSLEKQDTLLDLLH